MIDKDIDNEKCMAIFRLTQAHRNNIVVYFHGKFFQICDCRPSRDLAAVIKLAAMAIARKCWTAVCPVIHTGGMGTLACKRPDRAIYIDQQNILYWVQAPAIRGFQGVKWR